MNQNQNKSIGTRAKEKIQSLFREPKTEAGRIRRRIAGRVGITSLAVLMIGAILFALTSAWYTNTIQANEITLKTAKWNFDGTITLDGEKDGTLDLGDLYPGDTRLLPVTIVNQDTRGVNVRVEADKSKMASPEMQQRLYLYVEVTDEATNTKTRRYINSLSGYLYTVAAKQTLHITDVERTLSANEAQNKNTLHLQWVYDMTGYFLLGTVTEKDSTITVTGKAADSQPEYLMPVIYDLDRAQFGTDGKLSSVSEYQTTTNGTSGYATTSREDYLMRLFDQYISGYNKNAKPYDKATTIVRGSYYAVDVDETGYGVWLYLPDKAAIDAAAQWDQNTEKSENAQPISLNLVFKGQNQPTTTTGKEQQP